MVTVVLTVSASAEVLSVPVGPWTSVQLSGARAAWTLDAAIVMELVATANNLAAILLGGRDIAVPRPSMFWTATDDDLRAIFAYLRSLPPVNHHATNAEPIAMCRKCGTAHGGGALNH